jgi:hypothetical protein
MSDVVGPGFISITVSDVQRSADFYERHLELPSRSRGRGTPGREGPAADGRRLHLCGPRSGDPLFVPTPVFEPMYSSPPPYQS